MPGFGEEFAAAALSDLGVQLRQLRRARSLTQHDLSSLSGVTQPEISRIESGHANPTAVTVARLAQALRVHLSFAPAEENA